MLIFEYVFGYVGFSSDYVFSAKPLFEMNAFFLEQQRTIVYFSFNKFVYNFKMSFSSVFFSLSLFLCFLF